MLFNADKSRAEVGWRNFGWLWPYVRPQRGALASVVALATFISVLATLQPYLSKLIIDDALLGRNFPLLVQLCCLMVGLAIVAFAIGGFNRWRYVRVSGRILFAMREDVYAHLLTLSPEFFRQRPVGDLVTRLDGDVAEVQRFSTDTLLTVFNSALLLIATAIIMTLLSWQLALVAAAVLPLQLALRHKTRPWISGTARSVREQASEVTHFLVETLGAVKAVQGATTEDWERRRLNELNRGYLERLLKQQLAGYATGGLSSVLSHCATAAVFIAGGYGVMQGSLTIGTLVAFVAYMSRSTGSALSLLNLYTAYQRAAVSLERVQHLRDASSQVRVHLVAPIDRVDGAGHLHLYRVTLRRDAAGRSLLDGASLDIAAGSKIVLSGASGVGKTTLADALRGFVQIESGCIRLDGQDLGAYDLKTLRRRVVAIEAEPTMFGGSLLHNLRYGNFEASEIDVLDAARRTGVDAFVSDLPDGYGTRIGDSGSGISAGQKQRVALTRALLAQPTVLILDEATSHLDPAATAALHALIDEHFAGQTRIVITHAPQAVPRADAVYDLIAGKFQLRSRAGLAHV